MLNRHLATPRLAWQQHSINRSLRAGQYCPPHCPAPLNALPSRPHGLPLPWPSVLPLPYTPAPLACSREGFIQALPLPTPPPTPAFTHLQST